jgi:tetratricopeptide (TPR) repeat protein
MRILLPIVIATILAAGCNQKPAVTEKPIVTVDTLQGVSLFGEKLIVSQLDPVKDSARIANFIIAEKLFTENPDDADAIIWLGRRYAYLGEYNKAIAVFTLGIEKFPDDARMYRHRGHRYITLRKFDMAIEDLGIAANLVAGKEDIIEPDGVPNIRNTPVSSLNTNIWYHLGLAHYLKNDMEQALPSFQQSLIGITNPDMHVATSNWLYMINRRIGSIDNANSVLSTVTADMDVFENMAYHNLLLYYKGEISEEDLGAPDRSVDYINEATAYGVGNWYLYNGDTAKAIEIFEQIVSNGNWAAFGYISAEADLQRLRKTKPE